MNLIYVAIDLDIDVDTDEVSQFAFCCYNKGHDQNNLGEERLYFLLCFHVIVYD